MEVDVVIRCRKSDKEVVESVLAETGTEYVKSLKKNVPKLKDKEFNCKLKVDDKGYLPEMDVTNSGVPSW
jgi:hypothetical protein